MCEDGEKVSILWKWKVHVVRTSFFLFCSLKKKGITFCDFELKEICFISIFVHLFFWHVLFVFQLQQEMVLEKMLLRGTASEQTINVLRPLN